MNTVQTLAGKEIVVAVTGSIAAVEIVKLIHALRRCGASVQPVMSVAAAGIVHPDALTYAAGRETICRISGLVEHVTFCGDGGSADLLLVAPCTANTIGKIACGIDDTPVTTFASTAIGSGVPVIVVPAMHHSMFRHPAVAGHLRTLAGWGVVIAGPVIAEGKAKIAPVEEIVLRCERACTGGPLLGKKVLVTSGSCREPVDDIRVLTTRSTGRMGRALALQAFRLGADVTVVHRDTFPCVNNIRADTAAEMCEAVLRSFGQGNADIYVSAAAISDFAPRRTGGKIPSGKPVSLALEPLPKLIDEVKERFSPEIIAFKLGTGQEDNARKMIAGGIRMVLVNAPETMGSEDGNYTMMTVEGAVPLSGSKEAIAAEVWEAFSLLKNP